MAETTDELNKNINNQDLNIETESEEASGEQARSIREEHESIPAAAPPVLPREILSKDEESAKAPSEAPHILRPFHTYTKEERETAAKAVYADLLAQQKELSPADEIALRITEDHITEYLEGNREAKQQEFKDRRETKLLTAVEIIAALASVVLIVYFLKDNPAILVNILYIIGALGGLWLWKRPHDTNENK